MVGCDDVNPARAKGFYQRVSILSTFNGRVAFDEIIKPTRMIGRAALYDVCPNSFDAAYIIDRFLHVFANFS